MRSLPTIIEPARPSTPEYGRDKEGEIAKEGASVSPNRPKRENSSSGTSPSE